MYRWCEDGQRWLSTTEYTVDESGQKICPDDDHRAVVGSIQGPRHRAVVTVPREDRRVAVEQAKRRGLIDDGARVETI